MVTVCRYEFSFRTSIEREIKSPSNSRQEDDKMRTNRGGMMHCDVNHST
jgi:hypothetical protein